MGLCDRSGYRQRIANPASEEAGLCRIALLEFNGPEQWCIFTAAMDQRLEFQATLSAFSFGSLERIYFRLLVGSSVGNVCCHIAVPVTPLSCGVGICFAIPAGGHLGRALASLAFLVDFVADAAVEGTSFC